jgi:HEAT repeat protein
MKPGSASYTVAVDDVAVCVAAWQRFGPEVRRDVICNVTSVAAPGRKAAAALLVAACDDVDADVRRLAVWGLQGLGKRLARPHIAMLQAMQHDSDAGVRRAAEATLRWLE